MKIEEEIKQRSFKNEHQKLMINLLFTGKWANNLAVNHIKQFGLTIQQYNVLRILRGQKKQSISVNAISERMIDKMSNVSRLIDKLESKHYIKRKINSKDRRQVDIQISDKGLNLIQDIEKTEDKIFSNFQNLSKSESEQLNSLLDKLRS